MACFPQGTRLSATPGTGSFTQSGGTHTVDASGFGAEDLTLGYLPGSKGTYNLIGGILGMLTAYTQESVGYLGTGTFTQSGGTHSVSPLSIGEVNYGVSGSGTYILSGGLLSAGNEGIGDNGTFTQTGGTHAVYELFISADAGRSATYNLRGGSLYVGAYGETIDTSGTGGFTQSGRTNSVSSYIVLGSSPDGNGAYNLSGGFLSAATVSLGVSGTGSFTQSSGTNSVSGGLVFAQNVNPPAEIVHSVGTYNLNGGLLTLGAGGLSSGSGAASFNFGGGTLGATAPWSSSMNLNLAGSGGAATIDTTGGNISLTGNLTGAGTLNKVGPGILSLSGTNSVLGSLFVNGGTLEIPSGSLTAVTEYVGYNGNGTLTQTGGTNTITNTLYLAANGPYNLYGGLLVVPSISGSAFLNISGGTLTGGTGAAAINVPVFLNSAPVTAVAPSITFNALSEVIDAAPIGGPGGPTKTGPAIWVYSAANSYTGNTMISQGAVELADPNAAQNTTLVVNASNGLLFGPGIGTFNLGGLAGSGSLTLSDTTGTPINLFFGGNNQNTIYGGTISGAGTLTKAGNGATILTGNNRNWTGRLRLDPGIVGFTSDAALGAATNPIDFLANATLQAAADAITLSPGRVITIDDGAATATFDTQGYTLTAGCPIGGPGGVAKAGSGTLVLCGSNTYTGNTTVSAGTLKLDFSQPDAPAANIINYTSDVSSLTLGVGTLALQGNPGTSNSQQFNGLTVNSGCSAIVLSAAASNSLLLSLGAISRGPGGTVDFTLPGGLQSAANGITTSSSNTNGILGGYLTVSGTGWAVSSGAADNIMAYQAYTGGDLGNTAQVLALPP